MKKNVIALLLFMMLLAGLAMYNIKFFLPKKHVRDKLPVSEKVRSPTHSVSSGVQIKRIPRAREWGRNPFYFSEKVFPTVKGGKEPFAQSFPEFKLEMIFNSNGQRAAILSGQFVKEGDHIGVERVEKIGLDMVLLTYNGSKRAIKIDRPSHYFHVER